mmetsp:Transcript_67793/g.161792  ORF Transcript_67793/g.161792 Transcript_67793/m.161792 type:complete len:326 (+) Transcript_67793:1186-2163(+)
MGICARPSQSTWFLNFSKISCSRRDSSASTCLQRERMDFTFSASGMSAGPGRSVMKRVWCCRVSTWRSISSANILGRSSSFIFFRALDNSACSSSRAWHFLGASQFAGFEGTVTSWPSISFSSFSSASKPGRSSSSTLLLLLLRNSSKIFSAPACFSFKSCGSLLGLEPNLGPTLGSLGGALASSLGLVSDGMPWNMPEVIEDEPKRDPPVAWPVDASPKSDDAGAGAGSLAFAASEPPAKREPPLEADVVANPDSGALPVVPLPVVPLPTELLPVVLLTAPGTTAGFGSTPYFLQILRYIVCSWPTYLPMRLSISLTLLGLCFS